MDNDIHIKSADLCERCVYSYKFCPHNCSNCRQLMYASADLSHIRCRCDTIQFGTPCPYFDEAKGEIELRPICTESTALDDLIRDLRRMRVETGSLVCIGCGHEHNCSIHGCAIINKAIAVLETCAGLLSGRKEVSDCQDPNNAAK